MPENESNPTEPTGNSDPDPVDEAEIDRILAEAAGLTEQLQDEVGLDTTADIGIDGLQDQPEPTDVDSQVNRVEELLRGVASGEVSEPVGAPSGPAFAPVPRLEASDGGVEPAPDADTEEDVDDASSARPNVEADTRSADRTTEATEQTEDRSADSDSATADDSDDETKTVSDCAEPIEQESDSESGPGPESEPEPEQKPEHPSALQPDESTPVPSITVGLKGPDESASSASSNAHPESTDNPPLASCDQGTDGAGITAAAPNAFADLIRRLRDSASRVPESILLAFDLIDTRCAWISYRVRRVIGWVALALLVAAGSITAYSLS